MFLISFIKIFKGLYVSIPQYSHSQPPTTFVSGLIPDKLGEGVRFLSSCYADALRWEFEQFIIVMLNLSWIMKMNLYFLSFSNNEKMWVVGMLYHGRQDMFSCVVSTMSADGLAIQGAKASTATVFNHWSLNEIKALLQTTVSNVFFNEIVLISIKTSLKFIPKSPITNIAALVQIIAGHWPGDKPLSEPMMMILLMYISIPQFQWVNIIVIEYSGFSTRSVKSRTFPK